VLDLGGEGHGARKEENVFAIQTPVAICLAVRIGAGDSATPATVHYARLRGTRSEKLERLQALSSLADLEWSVASEGWHDTFLPAGRERWLAHPALVDLFPVQTPGAKVRGRSLSPKRTQSIAGASSPALHRKRSRAFSSKPASVEAPRPEASRVIRRRRLNSGSST
jgi:hypothetical protein